MIDHIGFAVSDISTARDFYAAALAPLGIEVMMEVTEEMTGGHGAHVGFGGADKPYFWIGSGRTAVTGVHVAFAAQTRELVDAFYAAAMAAGGTDNGAPGLRPEYHPNYYGAFVLDPDGNNIEAVCHAPVD
ncbi:VOC family protein [Tropicimonas isoalkanivorans]|uniref:Catechol 2,3-dioxygenase n=1 Tax=Tropicimonas isoalkanivorans TaxID=441112 RepID=A0A1I1RMN6_9RHOB|nr:VOC family protein [Tropicimonas isoalkanivorans]SFD31680.1 Catechol 2,3-dioxygenase [Tropicimonas isoalkanivorans]